LTPLQRAKDILAIDKDIYWIILVYGISVSVLSLIIPIAAQVLVNIVSFGTLLQPLVILACIVFFMLGSGAVLRIFQASMVELVQQKIFANVALTLAERLPLVLLSAFNQKRRVEIANRFFDVFLIQKSTATILISGLEVMLQAFFSMVLLAFYHPLLLAFDLCLITALVLVLWLPWRAGLKSALQESQEKYEVAGWLEELLHNLLLFKVQNNAEFALKKADEKIAHYLLARKKHFKNLLVHFYGTYGIYVISSSALLGIGGFLVIHQQLTLGQLVAAEIVLSSLVTGIINLNKHIENVYDLLASSEKLGILLELPIEQRDNSQSGLREGLQNTLKLPPSICAENLSFIADSQSPVFQNLSFNIEAQKFYVIYGTKGTGKSVLINVILGFIPLQKGLIKINEVPLQEYPAYDLRNHFALIRSVEIFTGSILENLILHRTDISLEKIYELLKQFDLLDAIAKLPEGLHTGLPGNHKILSTIELQKLMLVRALLAKPSLILIDGALDHMSQKDFDLIQKNLIEYQPKFTLIVTTRREDIAMRFPHKITL
jgi:putative ABC transport system ATP-binding protein